MRAAIVNIVCLLWFLSLLGCFSSVIYFLFNKDIGRVLVTVVLFFWIHVWLAPVGKLQPDERLPL
jgi:lipid-A-disaccharide synthase-like uncharacterized protein